MGTISIEVTGINDAPKVVVGAMTIGEGGAQILTGSANPLDPSGILNISDVEGDEIQIAPISSTIEILTGYRIDENSDFYKVQLFESDLLALPDNIAETFASLSELSQVLRAISSLNLSNDRYRLMDGPDRFVRINDDGIVVEDDRGALLKSLAFVKKNELENFGKEAGYLSMGKPGWI